MLQYNPVTDGITQSMLAGFLKCRVFADLNLQGWTSLKTGAALQFGELAHGVLEDVYTEVQNGRKEVPERDETLKLIRSRVDAWQESPRGSRSGSEEFQQLEQNAALLEAVLPSYFKFWGKEDFSRIKWVALEKEFEIKLFDVVLRGKIDGVYRDAQKTLRLFETKTKGRIDEQHLYELLAFDFQTDFYAIACNTMYGELPAGARYNIIRRPGEKLKKGESLTQFRQRVEDEVLKEPKYYFVRYQIDKPRKDLAQFRKELEQKIKDFVDWRHGKLPTYRNETACMGQFGACWYLKICSSKNYDGFYQRKTLFQELAVKETK